MIIITSLLVGGVIGLMLGGLLAIGRLADDCEDCPYKRDYIERIAK